MPRRYYTRTRPRYYGKRRKWSPTLLQSNMTLEVPQTGDTAVTAFNVSVLCANSAVVGVDTPVSTVIKVKNFRVNIDITATNNFLRNNFYAIMFIPQGFTPTADTPTQHPEWIMAWRTHDPSSTSVSTAVGIRNFQISSRLTRNLNSGDRIVLYQSIISPAQNSQSTISTAYFASFVTCNN